MPANLSKPVIGLTGGIGSGKSLVAGFLANEGCYVIDSDRIAADVLASPAVQREVIEAFGDAVAAADGQIDRKAVARLVFDDTEALKRLEGIIHPHVHERRGELRLMADDDPAARAIVEDCPLLIEKGLDAACDVVIFVASSRQARLGRVASGRGWTDSDLRQREKNQLSLDFKRRKADYVVTNDTDPASCRQQVREVLSQILPNPA